MLCQNFLAFDKELAACLPVNKVRRETAIRMLWEQVPGLACGQYCGTGSSKVRPSNRRALSVEKPNRALRLSRSALRDPHLDRVLIIFITRTINALCLSQ
jgi:hypothetical protein